MSLLSYSCWWENYVNIFYPLWVLFFLFWYNIEDMDSWKNRCNFLTDRNTENQGNLTHTDATHLCCVKKVTRNLKAFHGVYIWPLGSGIHWGLKLWMTSYLLTLWVKYKDPHFSLNRTVLGEESHWYRNVIPAFHLPSVFLTIYFWVAALHFALVIFL